MTPAPPRRTRLQAIAVLAATFIVGIVLGVTGERVRASRTEPVPPWTRERPTRTERVRDPERLPPPLEQLDLSDEQRERIRDVFRETQPRTDEVMTRMLPELRALRDSVRIAIEGVLTPEQMERLTGEFGEFWSRGAFPGDRFRGGPRGAGGRRGGRFPPPPDSQR